MKIIVDKNTDLNNLFKLISTGRWDLTKQEEKRLKTLNRNFENFLAGCKNRTIKYIPAITGFEWVEKEIVVYVVLEKFLKGPSVSYPLIIKTKKDFDLIVAVFLHELIHHNLNCEEFKKFSKGKSYEKEGAVKFGIEDVVNAVLCELLERLKKKSIIEKFGKYLTRNYGENNWGGVAEFRKKWNLKIHTLKEIISDNK